MRAPQSHLEFQGSASIKTPGKPGTVIDSLLIEVVLHHSCDDRRAYLPDLDIATLFCHF